MERTRDEGETRRTVIIALLANSLIALAKLAGGLLSGSSALLAEAAHSIADTTNQVFLLVSIALGGRDPNPGQPFGHGRERFLWSFVAAVGMFLAGAVFAIGVWRLRAAVRGVGDRRVRHRLDRPRRQRHRRGHLVDTGGKADA